MSSLGGKEKKALVKLFLKDEESSDVIELGFAVKLKQNEEDKEAVLITSSGVLPQTTDANKVVVLQEYLPKYKFPIFSKLMKSKNALQNVTKIEHHETMDVSMARYEGGDMDSNFLYYGFLSEKQKKEVEKLSAYAFDDREVIELQFSENNQEESYKLSNVGKEDFDVKRAKGAPVICQLEGKNAVVGVLGSNDNLDGDPMLYPILFKEGTRLEGRQFPRRQGQETIGEYQSALQQGHTNVQGPYQLPIEDTILDGHSSLQQGQDTIVEGCHALQTREDITVGGQQVLQTREHTTVEDQYALQQGQDTIVQAQSKADTVFYVTYNVAVKDNAQVAVGNNSKVALSSDKNNERVVQKCDAEIEGYTNNLKSSIIQQTDFQQKLRKDRKIRTDDIFTNVTIQRGQKQFATDSDLVSDSDSLFLHTKFAVEGTSRRLNYEEQGKPGSVVLKRCSEMFICPETEGDVSQPTASSIPIPNPKSILLIGKAGIGKTLFCQKIVRDWADGTLFEDDEKAAKIPAFQFVSLLTFRQLNLRGNEELDLRQLLNCSSVLDEQSVIDEGLMQYIIQNPEKLLIVIDGFDEYKLRNEITGDFETKYPNDPYTEMPVSAMLAKLLKGKFLKDSVVMVTSRPGATEEIEEMIFDATVEIQGFSRLQVMEYVGCFFKDNQKMKMAVLDHLKTNENLVSFGHIPVMCFLMCYYMEWNLTHSKGKMPLSRSDLFHEVIRVFLKKHHTFSKYAEKTSHKLEETLYKLAELAANLMREQKFIFDEEDMKRSNLNDEEIENLKASGLLDCCPDVKKSPFAEVRPEYTFTHLTLQEFLTALWFVENKLAPEKSTTGMTLVFMSGLLSRKKDKELMRSILELVKPLHEYSELHKLRTLQCLFEYNDDELSKRVISSLRGMYCIFGRMEFSRLTNADVSCISYLLGIINLLDQTKTERSLKLKQRKDKERKNKKSRKHKTISEKELQSQPINVTELRISSSSLSASGVKLLCNSLSNVCSIRKLMLIYCEIDDECIEFINELLLSSNIAHLELRGNNVSDKGLEKISEVITSDECAVECVNLDHNENITDRCKERHRSLVQELKPGVSLILDFHDFFS